MNDHDHKDALDQGLLHDLAVLSQLRDRRCVLRWLAAAGVVPVFGCSGSTADANANAGASGADTAGAGVSGSATAGTGGADGASCAKIPEETAGPYPGDGSNGPQILTASGIVRDEITKSFGTLSGTAAGIPLEIKLKIVDASGCADRSG